MTKDDMLMPPVDVDADADGNEPHVGVRILRIIGTMFGLAMIAGVFVGFSGARGAHPDKPISVGVMLFLALIIVAAMWLLWVGVANIRAIVSGTSAMPRREKRSTSFMIGCLVIGGLIGAGSIAVKEQAPGLIFAADGRLLPVVAIVCALLWGLAGPLATHFWLGQTDEHERSAYAEGGNWTAHALLFAMPVWWLLWKAGLTPAPDVLVCVGAASLLWCAVWYRKKFY